MENEFDAKHLRSQDKLLILRVACLQNPQILAVNNVGQNEKLK